MAADDPPVPAPRLRIGLLGGSFDPAHQGHLGISLEALKRLRLDRVWWLVSPQNPLKANRTRAGLDQRLATARRLVADHRRIIVTDLEQRLGTSYTVDTVHWLKRRSRAQFVWLMGADNLAQLPEWHLWRHLVRLVPVAVFDREPYSYHAVAGRAARVLAAARRTERRAATIVAAAPPAWAYLRVRRQRESSTAIRRAEPALERRTRSKETGP